MGWLRFQVLFEMTRFDRGKSQTPPYSWGIMGVTWEGMLNIVLDSL
jgi:hypothetical protein